MTPSFIIAVYMFRLLFFNNYVMAHMFNPTMLPLVIAATCFIDVVLAVPITIGVYSNRKWYSR